MESSLPASPTVDALGFQPVAGALFPVFLRLEQLRVLLVGAGSAGLEVLRTVLDHSPATAVTVVAPAFHPALQALADRHPRVSLIARPFQPDDLAKHDVVFIATRNPVLRRHIKASAKGRGLLSYVAGAPEESDFTLVPVEHQTRSAATARQPTRANELARGLAYEMPATAYWRRRATAALTAFATLIILNILSYFITWPQVLGVLTTSTTFYTFVAVGFVAQLIDGLLGMGYGVVAAISLMSMGLQPAAVSASIHTAEMFASGASGYHHYKFGNVNKRLFKVLLLPGIAGAVSGAFLLSYYGEQYANWVKPLLAVYLLVLGLRILTKAFRDNARRRKVKNAGWLAGAGGFLDSFGGGGWGPLVTSTLIANGRRPQYVIGTVSLTEFFVTFSSAFTFFAMLGIQHWQIVLGLIVGGVAAAPLAARLAGRIPTRWMFVGVGLMVICWSLWALRKVFF